MERKPNRLINERSPYLLQHAYNPVDWYAWGEIAFERAKAEGKPIFLSIGYASCHWCHVMEKECFEDHDVAALMNQTFINIKVDREERPDIDGFFMEVCQAMGKNCGWPLNIIMTPEKHPFFAASFIPKHDKFGAQGMMSLIPIINDFWKNRKSEAENYGREIQNRIENSQKRPIGNELTKTVLAEAYDSLVMNFDEKNGGFGNAPKFPSPHALMFLLRYWRRNNEKMALAMVQKTLDAMRRGGIFDQIGFGFHRYSTDAYWLVPHFEKMLYDQAMLTITYLEGYQATKNDLYRTTAKETIEYVTRDLSSSTGGFFGAEDADSEGDEGKFYLWTEKEILSALPLSDSELAISLFGIEPLGNYYESGASKTGKNIPRLSKSPEQFAKELGVTSEDLASRFAKIRKALFENREKRVHPSKDDKVLTDWNGLMIAALAKAAQVFHEEKYLEAARKAADFFLGEMQDANVGLYHSYVKGSRSITGFLDDYTFLAWGLIELYEASFDDRYLHSSVELTKKMIEKFWDKSNGGFFFTQEGTEHVSPMRKESYDGALPSGNSVAFLNLLRLARITGDSVFEETAIKLSKIFSDDVLRSPAGHTFMLLGVDFATGPAYSVVLVGDSEDHGMQDIVNGLREKFAPNVTISLRSPAKSGSDLFGLKYEQIDGKPTAYVCRNQTCLPPSNKKEQILELLEVS